VRRALGPASVEVGGRWTWIEQSNRGTDSRASASDNALTGFVGLRLPLTESVELAANLGTGFRFPGLSERFFTGSTGRGEILANADLDPERSLSIDTGLRVYRNRLYLAAYLFRTDVDDYIEQVETVDGVTTHVNLTSGTIEGVELEGAFELRDGLQMTWAGQLQEGRTDGGGALANVPADRVELGLFWSQGAWRARGRVQHRFSKDDPGSGEQSIPSAELLSLSVARQLGHGLELRISGDNLLDETYFPSADDLGVPAAGSSFGLSVGWRTGRAAPGG
jgi:iron complex outermembrane receptor protein